MTHFIFPNVLNSDVNTVLEYINLTESEDIVRFNLEGNMISFPYRIYSDDVSDDLVYKLNEIQQLILYCIYSRHYDGFVRQKYISKLLSKNIVFFSIPYIFKICDEYVLEIIDLIYSNLRSRKNKDFKEFCYNNKAFYIKSCSRMISYWNAYYRNRFPNMNQYVGKKLFDECFLGIKNV